LGCLDPLSAENFVMASRSIVCRFNKPRACGRAAHGFTLIELLVVIGIIGIIAAMALLIASRVTEGGRADQTRNILKTLDQTLGIYAAERDARKFPSVYTDETAQKNEWPIIDARLNSAGFDRTGSSASLPEPTVQLFLLASGQSTSILSAVNGIEGTFKNSGAGGGGRLVQLENVVSPAFGNATLNVAAPRVRDPWGNDIRYVHPRYHGGYGDYYTFSNSSWSQNSRSTLQLSVKQNGSAAALDFRRSAHPFNPDSPPTSANPIGDGDEGLCSGTRPYFYSPGPDHDPGTRDDNVYIEKPAFPKETQSSN
jgi:prepilin-type N-terminal cleavage/methylation domain-containing protein